jgi:MFS transporter, OFA family, oxalate/formate antiporter
MVQSDSKIYYGWYITGIAFWAYFLSVGTGFYAFNAFLEPLCNSREWSRTDLNLALVIGTVFGFSSQYIFGTLLMKIGIRILMLTGSLAAGISFIFIARVQTLWEFYLFYALLFIGNGAYGGIVASSAVSNWFIEKRGKAIGIATAGMSISGAVLPIASLLLIQHTGLSNAALVIGITIASLGPVAWFVIKDWPEDIGLAPDGFAVSNVNALADISRIQKPALTLRPPPWNLNRLVRTDVFWKLGLAFGLLMVGTVGVMSQLKPRFTDIGFSHMTAMLMMSATALFGAAGKYIWGIMCDRFESRNVAILMAAANALGLCLILIKNSFFALLVFIPVFGFAMGGIMSAYPIMVASIFGRESFASVLRFISIFLILQMFGYIIAGQSYDRTGSYDAAYWIFIGLDLIAVLLLFSLKDARKNKFTF